jgi:hypothetical protein
MMFAVCNLALNCPIGSPQHEAAVAICHLRGINPDDSAPRFNAPPLPNWRYVVAEIALFHMAGPQA